MENEYRWLEEKLKSLTRGLNKRVSMTGWDAWGTSRCSDQYDVWAAYMLNMKKSRVREHANLK